MTREEAIEVICKNWPDDRYTSLRESLKTLIPELHKSEDEKVRKALIDGIRQIRCKNGVTQEQMLAWLEKQKPSDPDVKGRRGRIGNTPEHIRKKAENFLSKMEPPYDADDICSAYETGAIESIKPEWNEEDERIRKDIIALIEFGLTEGSAVSPGSYTTKEEALAWLEKQKPVECHKDTLLEWAKLVLKCQEEELAKYDDPSYMKASTMGRIDAYKVLIAKLNSL